MKYIHMFSAYLNEVKVMNEKNKKVCAVVVTYNRKELLCRNIKSLLKQTYPVDILIYDNASTDGTEDELNNGGYLAMPNIIYVKGKYNGGGATGFSNGEKLAYDKGYDYVWLMDDDGFCVNDYTLENLMLVQSKVDNAIVNSYVMGNIKDKEPTFDLGPYKTYGEILNNSVDGIVTGYGNPYNGTLVPRECFEAVGFTDRRFFIYGDETDFYYRTIAAGYTWMTSLESEYYHPVNRSVFLERSFLGFKIDVKDQPVWKHYLENRNGTYIKKKYLGIHVGLRHIVRILLTSILSKDKRAKRIYYGLLGLYDGNKEYFGRQIMFNA